MKKSYEIYENEIYHTTRPNLYGCVDYIKEEKYFFSLQLELRNKINNISFINDTIFED